MGKGAVTGPSKPKPGLCRNQAYGLITAVKHVQSQAGQRKGQSTWGQASSNEAPSHQRGGADGAERGKYSHSRSLSLATKEQKPPPWSVSQGNMRSFKIPSFHLQVMPIS